MVSVAKHCFSILLHLNAATIYLKSKPFYLKYSLSAARAKLRVQETHT